MCDDKPFYGAEEPRAVRVARALEHAELQSKLRLVAVCLAPLAAEANASPAHAVTASTSSPRCQLR